MYYLWEDGYQNNQVETTVSKFCRLKKNKVKGMFRYKWNVEDEIHEKEII